MDAKQIAERHIVERYLANQLTDLEAEAFEAYVEAHPEVVREIDLTARMKSGLATLRQRSELETALRAKPSGLRRPALLAASVAVILIAGAFIVRQWSVAPGAVLLASTAEELLGKGDQPLPVAAHLFVTRTRGEPAESLAAPPPGSVVELRLDLHAVDSSARYSVQLLRVSGSALEDVGALSGATTQADGSLSFFVRGSALTIGTYLVRVAGGERSEPLEFALRVSPATP